MMINEPNEELAVMIAKNVLQNDIVSCKRMEYGSKGFVYQVVQSNNESFIIKLSTPDKRKIFRYALDWYDCLMPLDIPMAKFISHDLDGFYSNFPTLVMKKINGQDLGIVYSELSKEDKRNIGNQLFEIKNKVKTLPNGDKFGLLYSYKELEGDVFDSWYDFISNSLYFFSNNTRHEFQHFFHVAKEILVSMKANFLNTESKPFLWDIGSKNVLINDSEIKAIVDIEELGFGDHLFSLGLTYTSLEEKYSDTYYADHLLSLENLNDDELKKVYFYRLFFSLWFLSKVGRKTINGSTLEFNSEKLIEIINSMVFKLT